MGRNDAEPPVAEARYIIYLPLISNTPKKKISPGKPG